MWKSKSSSAPPAKKPSKEKLIDESRINEMFMSLADEDDPEIISSEGIGKFADNLEIDAAADVRILVLLWKLGAKSKPGSISNEEFMSGMVSLQKDSYQGLKDMLPSLDPGFLEKSSFREFYRFVFQFSKEGTKKSIEKEVIASLLPIVLDVNRAPHLNYFLEFLESCGHTIITFDQWDSFLPFNDSVKVNLDGYKDEDAWPLLLDEYVEWRRSKK